MLGLKSTLIMAGAGLVISLGLAYLWKSEQVKVAKLEGQLAMAMENTETLKHVVEDQKQTVSRLMTVVEENKEAMDELYNKSDTARRETAKVVAEINQLRAAEAVRSLAAPFSRGNVAHDRISVSLHRISGTSGGAGEDGDDTDAAGPGDSPRAP